MKIDNPRVRYHRNGCFGEGFHTVSFTEGRGQRRRFRRAVVFEGEGRVAVLDLNDAGLRFRGDQYEPALRAAIEAAGDSAYDDRPIYDGGLRVVAGA